MHEITMIGRTEVLDQAQIVGLNLSIHVVCILWYITRSHENYLEAI